MSARIDRNYYMIDSILSIIGIIGIYKFHSVISAFQ